MELTKIEKGTNDCVFDNIIENKGNYGVWESQTGSLIYKLIKKHNELVDYVKELEQKI